MFVFFLYDRWKNNISFFGAAKQLFGYAQVAKWMENIRFDRDVNKNCAGKWSDDRRNPTRQYEGTKHNVGFDTIDYLIDEYQIPSSGTGHKALFGKGMIAGQKVIVAKPMTYMNLSGESVRELVNYYKVDPESELIVVYDDISLAPGQIRIRKKGSAGGHNGIKNIIANLGTDHFMRVKVGVGEKPKNWDLADYVLSPFTKDERPLVNLAIEHAAKAIEQMLNGDVDAAMNEYNRKSANPAE